MAITYPIPSPAIPGLQKIKLSGQTQTSFSQSPFTGSEQVFEWPAEWWSAECTLPPMQRSNAAVWNSMLLALRGRSGTLLLGDSAAKVPRGAISAYPDLLRYTEQFDNAVWQKGHTGSTSDPTITANAIADPNSNLLADAINFAANSGGSGGFVGQVAAPFIPIGNRPFSYSVYLKVASGTASVSIQISDNATQNFANSITVTTAWQRFSAGGVFSNGNDNSQTPVGYINYSGAGAQTIYAWGAQIDRSVTPTGYSGLNAGPGPRVNGSGQTGKTLAVTFNGPAGLNSITVLKAGDYIMFSPSAGVWRLHKLLKDLLTDGSGNATADIFPRLRESPPDQTPIYWFDTRGLFRLAQNQNSWEVDEASIYGIQFQAIEAI